MYLDIRATVDHHTISALQAGQAAPAAPRAPALAQRFDAASLYGKGGPKEADIRQDALGDCYFVATLGAIAKQQPGRIEKMIAFDAHSGTFTVKLHDSAGKQRSITVSQADIADNIARHGGSTADNTGRDQRIWPAVIETAYARMNGGATDLNAGYKAIANGGWPKDAMQALTGDRGSEISYGKGLFEGEGSALDRTAKQVDAALGNHRPVTLWSVPEHQGIWDKIAGHPVRTDGLVNNHVYVVDSVAKDAKGEWQVTVRNPWATNAGVEGGKVVGPTITVPLQTLVDTGGLQSFLAGPAR